MTTEPLKAYAIELLTRGHKLYVGGPDGGEHPDSGLVKTPQTLVQHADRLGEVSTRVEMGRRAPAAGPAIVGLRRAAGMDTELAAVLADARTDHTWGSGATRAVLADAHADSMPAADTPLGQREALRRMAARLQLQRRTLHRSHQHSRLLAHRARRLAYLHRHHIAPAGRLSAVRAIPLGALRYDRLFAPGQVRRHIAAALDHLGITDPGARRNWLRGYESLVARESGGRPSAVAAEPATTRGAAQADGHGLGYARGITQTIPATFARYHQPGTSTNIFDPVANICASMNYVMHRYGVSADGANLVALVQQADARRLPKGY
jgi:SLT domain-containing protein